MLINYIMLALCVSIDSLGIGITYGLKNTRISNVAKLILFMISIFITSISVFIGSTISKILPSNITSFIGCFILCSIGFWIVFQALKKNKNISKEIDINNINNEIDNKFNNEETIYKFFIKFLGITIQIIRNPNSSDLDNSNNIDSKEAFYLGIALSLDSIGVGIGSSVIGINSLLFPILVAIFQLLFLSIGRMFGIKIKNTSNIPENIWSIVAGILLIFIGISKCLIGDVS